MENKIVVTGAGRGIGKAISEKLKQRNFSVLDLDKDVCDISDPDAIKKIALELRQKGIKISGLVNNAAINFLWRTAGVGSVTPVHIHSDILNRRIFHFSFFANSPELLFIQISYFSIFFNLNFKIKIIFI